MSIKTIIAAAIENAAPLDGVAWTVETDGDTVILTAAYDEDHEYTDEPWEAIGDIPEPDASYMTNDDAGRVFNSVEYRAA